ncbi:MAG: tyrosine-type recombinase/integrase [Bdellovibrionaceae bacterium]|nr:tyrosine-type recombinase/integrase [Pseudobdellovibrionaceae bacterium]
MCPNEIAFPNQKDKPHGPSARVFQEVFKRTLLRAGFKQNEKNKIVFHGLRHTFASHWMMRGGDLFKLQKILGHSTPQMTQRYAHLSPDAFCDDYSRLGTPQKASVLMFNKNPAQNYQN